MLKRKVTSAHLRSMLELDPMDRALLCLCQNANRHRQTQMRQKQHSPTSFLMWHNTNLGFLGIGMKLCVLLRLISGMLPRKPSMIRSWRIRPRYSFLVPKTSLSSLVDGFMTRNMMVGTKLAWSLGVSPRYGGRTITRPSLPLRGMNLSGTLRRTLRLRTGRWKLWTSKPRS